MRRVPIHRSGTRPLLIMGCDREAILTTLLIGGTCIFMGQTLFTAAVGLVLIFGGLMFFRRLAKKDPLMIQIAQRDFFHYQNYHPSHSTPWRENTDLQVRRYG